MQTTIGWSDFRLVMAVTVEYQDRLGTILGDYFFAAHSLQQDGFALALIVLASEANQSSMQKASLDCFVAYSPRKDGGTA